MDLLVLIVACDVSVIQGENALARGEVPVGAVFVYNGEIIARASNRTNELYNVRETQTYWLCMWWLCVVISACCVVSLLVFVGDKAR